MNFNNNVPSVRVNEDWSAPDGGQLVHKATEQIKGYNMADLLVKSNTERPCVALSTYRLWGPNELSPNHRL